MKKITLLASLFLSSLATVKSQHIVHGVGLGSVVDVANGYDTNIFSTLSYSPNFHFAETANSSFSIGVPLSVGFGFATSYDDDYIYGDDISISYMIHVPAIFSFNLGAGSSRTAQARWGFFFGAGYGYHYGTTYGPWNSDGYTYYGYTEQGAAGPEANTGFRVALGAKRKHNIETRFSYMKGLSDHKPSVIGATCYFNF